MRDNSLLAYSASFFDLAGSIDEDLSKYLITPETGWAFRSALDQFGEYIDKPSLDCGQSSDDYKLSFC